MRRFSRVGARAFEPVRIEGGAHSRAIIQRPADADRPGIEFVYANVICRVQRNSILKSGQVVVLPDGNRYLMADHSGTVDWVTHHLFRCDRQVTWERQGSTTDTLTGIPKETGAPAPVKGPIWVMWQKVRREFTDLTIRAEQENHLVATGENVLLGDIVAGFKVKRVNRALGVRIVELQA